MCPGDIEDALPNLDTLLGNKPKNFEFSNVNGAVNMRLPDSEHDPDGSMRVVAAAVSISLDSTAPSLSGPSPPLAVAAAKWACSLRLIALARQR
jgi:hypothetical protein